MTTRLKSGRFVGAATSESARRQLMQPVPCWEKVWVVPEHAAPGSNLKILKWVRTNKKQQFSDDEDAGADEPLAPLPDEPTMQDEDEDEDKDQEDLGSRAATAPPVSRDVSEPITAVQSIAPSEGGGDSLPPPKPHPLSTSYIPNSEAQSVLDGDENESENITGNGNVDGEHIALNPLDAAIENIDLHPFDNSVEGFDATALADQLMQDAIENGMPSDLLNQQSIWMDSFSSSSSLRILILGSGGREHALAWKIAQSTLAEKVYVAPGNAGTISDDKFIAVPIPVTDFRKLVEFSVENDVNLVIAGPEQPLVDVGIPFFGPSPRAAQMEGSKAFAKEFMLRHRIPTAAYKIFTKDEYEEASTYIKNYSKPIVLKASGLAAGKGVLIPQSKEEALKGLEQILVDSSFGNAGDLIVVEDYLTGPEVSVLAFSDGYTVIPLPAAQDHKRIGDGDTGPNTGGMGAYAPAPIATPEIMRRILKESLQPTIDGMRKEGFPFVGLLFTGFIITEEGPKVLEYNVRFGDPETEALMLLLDENTDLASVILACVERRLDSVRVGIRPGIAVSVVLASAGYPGRCETNKVITFPADETSFYKEDVVIFHAGTTISGDNVVTAGGRVLAVTAYGSTLQEALSRVYEVVDQIHFDGKTYRKDIAHRAIAALATTKQPLTYADAGVSIDAGNDLVRAIKPLIRTTRRPGSDADIGGFGGVFDIARAGYKDPVLVSGTDGVGTKLRVAMEVGKHDTVGIDLVAMSVNDLIVQGAEPLYFLDYYGCGKLDVNIAAKVISGIVEGCKESGCALIGGETAEMPGMYANDDYDLAGFAVGAVERDRILPLTNEIKPDDILIGIPSSGLHSNGFSLIRKIVACSSLSYTSSAPWNTSRTLGEELLIPTRLYPKLILHLLRQLPHGHIKGIVNITGGGFTENIPRVLPETLGISIDLSSWKLPPIFSWFRREGALSREEMCKTFNCGIGMVLIVSRDKAEVVRRVINEYEGSGEGIIMGKVTSSRGVVYSSDFLI